MLRKTVLLGALAAGLVVPPAFAQPRDGAPGNPPSTATQRTLDRATGAPATPPDATPGNPPGTAAGRAVDRTLGTNTTGANPKKRRGTSEAHRRTQGTNVTR